MIARPGRSGRALAAGRLHPRRDEHRQHVGRGRDDRLRPLRLHGRLRSRDGVQLHRPHGPLCLRQPAVASPHGTWLGSRRRLLPLLSEDEDDAVAQAQEALGELHRAVQCGLRGRAQAKARAYPRCEEDDLALAQQLLGRHDGGEGRLHAHLPPALRRGGGSRLGTAPSRALFGDPAAYFDGLGRTLAAAAVSRSTTDVARRQRGDERANPAFIPRNHRVEAVIAAAIDRAGLCAVRGVADGSVAPFEDRPEFAAYADPPPAEQRVYRTYCGT